MLRRSLGLAWACALLAVAVAAGCGGAGSTSGSGSRHEDLVALFGEWRAFQRPALVAGVPDYTATAMSAQYPGPRAVPPAPQRHRHARVARRPAGGLAPRAGGNERARFRSPGPQAVGQQPGLLRHVLSLAERPAGARGPAGVRRRRTLELPGPAQSASTRRGSMRAFAPSPPC